MGLLTEGSPLSWEETKKLSKHVRDHGIEQFINLYRRLKDRHGDILKWGDEVSKTPKENVINWMNGWQNTFRYLNMVNKSLT